MKLLCFGASVTAQNGKTGYFEHLQKEKENLGFDKIERISYGASHFDYAGFGFSREVIEAKPDVCIIDWLTPGSKSFSIEKIKAINFSLKEINCFPIWVNFPRVDDLNNERPCFKQVAQVCKDEEVCFWDLTSFLIDSSVNPKELLRDIVHTNEKGAVVYSNFLVENLKNVVNLSVKQFNKKIKPLPYLFDIGYQIDRNQKISLSISKEDSSDLEIIFNCKVGPSVCFYSISLYFENSLIETRLINPADPWCYYERFRVVPAEKFTCPAGDYVLVIEAEPGEPLEEIILRKPLTEAVVYNEKEIYFSKMSINVEILTLSLIK